jgi:hypothetical protein
MNNTALTTTSSKLATVHWQTALATFVDTLSSTQVYVDHLGRADLGRWAFSPG